MSATYTTMEGDTVDSICYQHYGSSAPTEQVLASNPGLADQGAFLQEGTKILLPTINVSTERETVQLWARPTF